MKKNVPILTTQLYLSLFLHIITSLLVAARDSPPIYTPVEDITVKCGYSGNLLNEYDERYWHGDINSNFSPATGNDTSIFREAPHSYTVHQVSYTTARLSRSEFTYSFKLTSGQKFIRLYFNPVSYGPDFDRSKALFSVKASGFTLLHDFNTSVTADAYGTEKIYREFCLNMESSEQSLNITFTPSPSLASPDAYAFINGIEIVSMPTNLYFTAAQSSGVGLVGKNFNFHIENNSALETVHRINVGGKSLFFSEDTGMYRNWDGEQEEPKYLDDLSIEFSVLPQNTSIELDFAGMVKYSAPKEVYQTGRSMGMNKTIKSVAAKSRELAIIAGVVSTVTIVMFLGLILVFRQQQKLKDSSCSSNRTTNSSLPSALCHYFSLEEIKAATRNFSDICIIGRGGFGNVYKGYIDGRATPVAIKRLKPGSSQGAHEFKTEIEMLSQLRHRHLVSLIGYCVDESEMILVYDFMDRGTLSDHLYHKDNPSLLWEQRLEICIGAARGLHYLHTGAMCTIIHRDVKSTNILLDEKWIAKVSDFGLSKMGATTMSNAYISTVVKGSFGYLDPEYYRRQQLSVKSDVYSFGVVLCEVLCGRPAVVRMVERRQMSLAEWAKTCHRNGTLNEIIDPCLKGKVAGLCFNKFVKIAMSCMHDNGIERPSMADVVRELEFALKLQQSADDNMDFNIVENNICEDEVAFIKDKEGSGKSEQSCATDQSIKWISETIFSEINNPDGR
ncbi:PREDICTED: receptor-like protein kinase FERONIA [Prunus mume]|uniref:Receptor-like protein kinase FERONIA n=1 Tax=Prunus mume TaxID=102107 RepID=A0ABM1LNR0_PRUMU|nr:PREDICTED: receptor-like protein kinase FERONIA [Prunus mume]